MIMNDMSVKSIARLIELVVQLRDPQSGCPWDQQQDFASIAPYTIEEAYEVADAITTGKPMHIKEELGDLLFQVVFHAQLAAEQGWFNFNDVAQAISEKMRRRHPHVFAGQSADSVEAVALNWEKIKQQERQEQLAGINNPDLSALASVPIGMSPLMRAAKLGRKASKLGFDWPNINGAWAKLDEELGELRAAIGRGEETGVRAELGDVLFSVVNIARHLGVEPDRALRETNNRFTARFRYVEGELAMQGLKMAETNEAELDRLWQAAKLALAD